MEKGFGAGDEVVDGRIHEVYCIGYWNAHIRAAIEAGEQDGVDLIGYTPWGIMDIVSYKTGEMKKRYDLIYVDRVNGGHGTMERLKKNSFYWYQQVIASNRDKL